VNFGFIKEFWEELKGDVMRFMLDFHRNGKLTRGINTKFIALIPKADSPQRLNDFCPISLVSCLYKILSIVLANRLRMVIGKVISETQTVTARFSLDLFLIIYLCVLYVLLCDYLPLCVFLVWIRRIRC
jgi:hypothetical protein